MLNWTNVKNFYTRYSLFIWIGWLLLWLVIAALIR